MKHIVSFSGGAGSYKAGERVVEEVGAENTLFVFTDTRIEDIDLYRFMYEVIKKVFGERDTGLGDLANGLKNRDDIDLLMKRMGEVYPENFLYLAEGRDVWEIFFDEQYIGNTRNGNCTRRLKQEIFREWLESNYKPDECIVYLGFDWTEPHRFEKAIPHWNPYTVKSPLCDEPYLTKEDIFNELKESGIEIPRLYKFGFLHNNCGGFCVKAGHGHFKLLLEKMPDRFVYHENKEKEWQQQTGKDNTILRDRRGGQTKPMSLEDFRKRIEEENDVCQLELDDFGGCGCYTGLY